MCMCKCNSEDQGDVWVERVNNSLLLEFCKKVVIVHYRTLPLLQNLAIATVCCLTCTLDFLPSLSWFSECLSIIASDVAQKKCTVVGL